MNKNISHGKVRPLQEEILRIRKKVEKRGDLPHATVTRQLELLEEMAAFPLGQFLLTHKGLDGFWIHYIVTYPEEKAHRKVTSLEEHLLSQMPTALATQERYSNFRKCLQRLLKDNSRAASIPCGMMGEFLSLDVSKAKGISLVGVDIESEEVAQARRHAEEKKYPFPLKFLQQDVWSLSLSAEFDVIASSGLSIYERDEKRLIELYRIFYEALKPGGTLVTSFLTYPPNFGVKSEWKTGEISLEAALLQRIIFSDLIESTWQAYRSSRETEEMLRSAGFQKVEMIYDKAHIFPTVLAIKGK